MQHALTEVGPDYDVVVLGAGAGGMSAAIFAAMEGARVLLVERTEYLGGTTSYSAATTWIPLTRHAQAIHRHQNIARRQACPVRGAAFVHLTELAVAAIASEPCIERRLGPLRSSTSFTPNGAYSLASGRSSVPRT